MVRDKGVAEHPLSSGTCLQLRIHQMAAAELLLPQLALPAQSPLLWVPQQSREDLAVLEGPGLVANLLYPQVVAQLSTEGWERGFFSGGVSSGGSATSRAGRREDLAGLEGDGLIANLL